MEQMEIREKIDHYYKVIEDAKKRMETIRKSCSHQNVKTGLYGNDVAHARDAKMCADCDEFIGFIDIDSDAVITASK